MEYRLNLIPEGAVTVIRASQGDTEERSFTFQLYAGKDLYALSAGEVVSFLQENGATADCTIVDGKAVLECFAAMTDEPGQFRCNLAIQTTGGVIHSAGFILEVEKRP